MVHTIPYFIKPFENFHKNILTTSPLLRRPLRSSHYLVFWGRDPPPKPGAQPTVFNIPSFSWQKSNGVRSEYRLCGYCFVLFTFRIFTWILNILYCRKSLLLVFWVPFHIKNTGQYVFTLTSCGPILDYHYLTALKSYQINKSNKNRRTHCEIGEPYLILWTVYSQKSFLHFLF